MPKPTAADKRHFAKVVELGCMACLQDGLHTIPEIHHCQTYGYRIHSQVFGLCGAHHRQTASIPGVLNRHGNPIQFAERYGTDKELLAICLFELRIEQTLDKEEEN